MGGMTIFAGWAVAVTIAMALAAGALAAYGEEEETRLRARDLGIPFDGVPGKWNAITDIKGVAVGHTTLIGGEGELVVGEGPVRTGVTAILPVGHHFRKIFASGGKLNGNGEMTGLHWVEESGMLEEPILFTNTHSVGAVHEGVITWRQENRYHEGSVKYDFASLPVVGETWDGRLNDIHGLHVRPKHAVEALNNARSSWVAEGNVGGGTGMVCFRFKGGIGTSSRITEDGFTVGAIVQANFGLREDFKIRGVPIGKKLRDRMPVTHSILPGSPGNSILVAIATDAPLLPHQLKRLALRIPLGIQRTGGMGYNSSGDLFIVFSTAEISDNDGDGIHDTRMLSNDRIDPIFRAVVETTEESIINALVAAESMTGINNNKVFAMPHDQVKQIFSDQNPK